MIDREKVIYGLHKTLGIIHMYVPKKSWGCGEQACRDALALLKEQEAVKPEWSNGKAFCRECGQPFPRHRRSLRRFLFILRTGGEVGMIDRRIIKAELQNLQKILEAKADMCIGAGKMKMLSFANACSGALEMLKEQEDQEYVEPIPTPTDNSGWFFKCNKCSNPINWKDKFCSMCGKAVKWNC